MTDIETTETESTMTEDPATEPEQTEPETEQLESSDDRQIVKLRKESARYRTQLRETQSQLEQAMAQLTAARRQIVAFSREVTGYVRSDAINDLLAEIDIDGLFDESGQLDSNGLRDAVQEQIRRRPHFDRQPGKQAMQTALSNSAPHVRQPVAADPLSKALRLRNC